jgi:hypothetical protein
MIASYLFRQPQQLSTLWLVRIKLRKTWDQITLIKGRAGFRSSTDRPFLMEKDSHQPPYDGFAASGNGLQIV